MTPTKLWTERDTLLRDDPPPRRDYIAEVEITTTRPCAPCRLAGEVWWPVGYIPHHLGGPEVRYAMTIAESVTGNSPRGLPNRVCAGRLGRLGDWTTGLNRSDVPPLVARVAKGWGRSVLGGSLHEPRE